LPLAELVEIPRCGHLSTLEAPHVVNEHLLDLLREVERRDRARAIRGQ
jgi:pimeloyl-ACP methyl ester carboxylesterase